MQIKSVFILVLGLLCLFAPSEEVEELSLNFSLRGDRYISPKSYLDQMDRYWNVQSQIIVRNEYKYFLYDIDMRMLISLDESEQYFVSMPSFNIGYKLEDIQTLPYLNSIHASVGRYKKHWSWVDHYWELGLWNPRNVFDYFNPEELGIVGSAVTFKGDQWSLTSLIGGLFLPNEQSALGKNKAGAFKSKSRWATPPASNLSILDKKLNSYYWIQEPYLTNVLLQGNYLFNAFLGNRQDKWLSFSYAHKPLNQNFYRVKSGIKIDEISGSSLDNAIYHHSLRHRLLSVESGLKWNRWLIELGIMSEELDPIDLPDNWITPDVPNGVFFASAALSVDFSPLSWNKNLIRIAYLESWIKESSNSSLIGGNIDRLVSLMRFKLRKGAAVDWDTHFFWSGKKKLHSFLRYWYAIDQKGGWLQWKFSYFFHSQLQLLFELVVIGSHEDEKKGFFSWYGNNDRLSMKVQYGF